MKRRTLFILSALFFLVFCEVLTQDLEHSSDLFPERLIELRPGVYVVDEVNTLPLPTFGYDLYVVGEVHGSNEVVTLFLDYLKRLHESVALRDVAFEASPVFERGVNEFVAGLVPTLPELWYWELAGSQMIDLFQGMRALNETLPEEGRVRVHLIDLDFGYELIHRHLLTVCEELGDVASAIEIPPLDEFETLSEGGILSLIGQLEAFVSEGGHILNELHGLRDSVRFRFVRGAVERWEMAANECTAIRDEGIAQNVQRLLDRLSHDPVLVLFGGAHVQKERIITAVPVRSQVIAIDELYWVERLAEEGMSICSLLTGGLSGSVASHGERFWTAVDPNELHFADGVTLGEILQGGSDDSLVYVDLRDDANAPTTLGVDFSPQTARFDPTTPAGEAFDGIILFKRLTPAW